MRWPPFPFDPFLRARIESSWNKIAKLLSASQPPPQFISKVDRHLRFDREPACAAPTPRSTLLDSLLDFRSNIEPFYLLSNYEGNLIRLVEHHMHSSVSDIYIYSNFFFFLLLLLLSRHINYINGGCIRRYLYSWTEKGRIKSDVNG